MSRIGVVVNPTAGRGRGRQSGARVEQALGQDGHDVIDLTGSDYRSAAQLARAAVRDGAVDVLVVVGGDGMVHLGVNTVADTGVPLGIVGVGTGNDFAHAVGLPIGRDALAIAALRESLTHPPRAYDAVQVEVPGLTEPRWFAGVLSMGIDAAINARANAIRWPKGAARYALAALLEIGAYRPYGYRVRLGGLDPATDLTGLVAGVRLEPDGEEVVWESPGALIAVANGVRVGGGIRIAPDALLDDGMLDVLLAGPFTRMQAVMAFPGMYRGSHVSNRLVGVLRARTVTLEPTAAGAAPPIAFADGEYVGPVPARAEIRPHALRVLTVPAGTVEP